MRNKKGFTLTEMIAVIVIIGLIILVAIPVSQNLTKNNKVEKYMLYVETIENAIYTYADLYMKSNSDFQLIQGNSVSSSDFFTTLNLEPLEGISNVTYSANYKVEKDSSGKIVIINESNSSEEFKLDFGSNKTCSKKACS